MRRAIGVEMGWRRPWILAIVLAAIFAVGCSIMPQSTTQKVYSVGWTLVGATNSIADLHDSGTLTGENYEQAKTLLLQAHTAYKTARASLVGGQPANAEQYLTLAQTLLNQLSAYLRAHGG